jgi:hypothetical protein
MQVVWGSPFGGDLEDSPSGLWRTLGKRVGLTPSGVRIPHPPPLCCLRTELIFASRHRSCRSRVIVWVRDFYEGVLVFLSLLSLTGNFSESLRGGVITQAREAND